MQVHRHIGNHVLHGLVLAQCLAEGRQMAVFDSVVSALGDLDDQKMWRMPNS
jgi:hypothetical protein